jgi:arylsulfatase A-like enzyme
MSLHQYLRLDRFEDIDQLIATYDGSIRYVDAQLARLFDYLRSVGRYDSALIIVTSDHGESFLERGAYISHGYTFFDEEVRVPLIVRLPGGARAGRVDVLVDHTDIAALILEAAGLDVNAEMSGASPLARLDGRAPERSFVRGDSAYTGGKYARSREWKVMSAVEEIGAIGVTRPGDTIPGFIHEEQIFGVSKDPFERINRADEPTLLPESVWLMRQAIGASERAGSERASRETISDERQKQLEALGYLQAVEPEQAP